MQGILFICGSLEPGRDGVGDYTRRIAADLQESGQKVSLLATHDRVVTSIDRSPQADKGQSISTLRIPQSIPPAERMRLLTEEVVMADPGWLSLQYVPYSFSKYGIPFPFLRALRQLSSGRAWHVMFHELWIGHQGLSQPKRWTISLLQRRAVAYLAKRLRPEVIHTHLPTYYQNLANLGLKVQPLPLFTTIEKSEALATTDSQATRPFRAAFFSQMNLPLPVLNFLRELKKHLDQNADAGLEILLLGGNKDKVNRTAATLRKEVPGAEVNPIGFLSSEALSAWLSSSDMAISPVPNHALGKSTTIAAFLVHGLPVAAPVIPEDTEGFFQEALNAAIFNNFDFSDFEKAQKAALALDVSQLASPAITSRFVNDLNQAASTADIPQFQFRPLLHK